MIGADMLVVCWVCEAVEEEQERERAKRPSSPRLSSTAGSTASLSVDQCSA